MSEAHYSVIRYMPDPGRGENLNIGILLWEEDSAEYRLSFDQKAIDRVVKENPHLERDSLLYIEPMLHERLASAVAPATARIKAILDHQGFPLNFTEPRFTTVLEDDDGLDDTLDRLVKRVVRPRRRYSPSKRPVEEMERKVKPLIQSRKVSRDYVLPGTKTGVRRSADFFANSGANVALDVVKLALKEADRIRERADAEAFKVADVLNGDTDVNKYFVYCQLHSAKEFADTNDDVRTIIEGQGARVLTDMDEAAEVLENAARES
jgi:DUF3037 family protein